MTRLIIMLSTIAGTLACVATVIAILATVHVARDDAKIRDLTTEQKEGRRVAVGVTCAAVSAVSQAGRATIANPTPLPPGVEALLEAHGFPRFATRKRAARAAADGYVRRISASVERQVGRKGDRLVNADGTLNCSRLRIVARTR